MVEHLTKEQYLETLEGQEIQSVKWEGVVAVADGQITRWGEVLCANPTVEQLSALMGEMFEGEFGTADVWSVLDKEFGEMFDEDEDPSEYDDYHGAMPWNQ